MKPGDAVFLAADRDGLEQIADVLGAVGVQGFSNIAIVGHGSARAIRIGATLLDDANLSANVDNLARIGDALAPNGSISLFSYNVASGDVGQGSSRTFPHCRWRRYRRRKPCRRQSEYWR